MSEPERISETRRWLRFAREDLAIAEALPAQTRGTARYACFLAQQAAEKSVKAVLVYLDMDVPYRHDLDALRNLVPPGWPFKEEHPHLEALTRWIAIGRYPGNWPEPTDHDAQTAIQQARAVLASVTRDLARHGLTEEPNE